MGKLIGQGFVRGTPVTKGSLAATPHRRGNGKLAITLHDKPAAEKWRGVMIKSIRDQHGIIPIVGPNRKIIGWENGWKPYADPVIINATFYVAQQDPTHRDAGDLDKLLRNLLDAFTQSGLIKDDSQVIEIHEARKEWTGERDPGVYWRMVAA